MEEKLVEGRELLVNMLTKMKENMAGRTHAELSAMRYSLYV